MLRFVAFATAAFFVFAACTSATSGSTTTTSSTTTTIENDNCERVGADTVTFLDSLIRTLDDTRLAEIRDREQWPDDLNDLERAGTDLDIRVAALGCDPAAIRQQALDEANLNPDGPLSEGLIDVLLTPPTTTTTSTTTITTRSTTTTESVDTTEGSAADTTGDPTTTTSPAETTTTGG